MVMAHGDDKGLVLPPRVAPLQVVIIPIIKSSLTPEAVANLHEYAKTIFQTLKDAKVRVRLDSRDNYTPGWKYNHWEQKVRASFSCLLACLLVCPFLPFKT